MKIGIIGLGSIGRRHARCLSSLGYRDLVALRTKKGALKELEDLSFIKTVYVMEELLELKPDGVIISNPTSLHVSSMLPVLKEGIPAFVEKPLSHNLDSVDPLYPYEENVIVGFCMRFNSIYTKIREYLEGGMLGDLYKANFYRSYYLPLWHPYADYRLEYTARKDLGGGVIRSLCHEIDLMYYLFGEVISVVGTNDRISGLDIDVDDWAFFSCKLKSGIRVNFELDYLSPDFVNKGELYGSKGKITFCFAKKEIRFSAYNGESKILLKDSDLDLNDMYLSQMKDFVRFIQTGESKNCRLKGAVDVLKIIDAVEKCKSVSL